MQQLVLDDRDVASFRENAIATYLLDEGPFDMNHLVGQPFSDQDREQFAQLIGYPVSGFCELGYVSHEACADAHRAADLLRTPPPRTPEEVAGDMRIAVAMMATLLEKRCSDPESVELLERPAVAQSVLHARAYLEEALSVGAGAEESS